MTEKNIKNMKFREAFNELQEILNKLEKSDLDIEEITSLYEEGIKFKEHCSEILNREKAKITEITEKLNNKE